jgi:hypothetical protein
MIELLWSFSPHVEHDVDTNEMIKNGK